MKKVLGLKFSSKDCGWALLEGNQEKPTISQKGTLSFPSYTLGEFLDWTNSQFDSLLESLKPDIVQYQLTRGMNKQDQVFHIYYPLGILNLISHNKKIKISHVEPSSIKRKLKINKSITVEKYIQTIFKSETSPWNANIREAVAIALMGLNND